MELALATLEKLDNYELEESLADDVQRVRAPKQFMSVREQARKRGHRLFSEGTGFPGGSVLPEPYLNPSITPFLEGPAAWLNCGASGHLH